MVGVDVAFSLGLGFGVATADDGREDLVSVCLLRFELPLVVVVVARLLVLGIPVSIRAIPALLLAPAIAVASETGTEDEADSNGQRSWSWVEC